MQNIMKAEPMYFFLYLKEVKTSFCLFVSGKERNAETVLLQSIHSVVKKQMFGKDRTNAVAKEKKKAASVKMTRHNSSHSGNQTFVSIIIHLPPQLKFYLRDFNAIFLN